MSKIGLHGDQTGFPNLALMKLSAWHKARGDDVSLFMPLETYDKIYSSIVFTYNRDDRYLPRSAIRGGTGYGLITNLPDDIEHICPDYDLYLQDFSMGFLTRGCIRKCDYCVVPSKEGDIRSHADIEEFLRHKDVVILDNNVLASPHGVMQIEKIAKLGVKVDFNQGLDARLIDDGIARLLSKLKWRSPLRLACDHAMMIPHISKAVQLLRWHNVVPRRYFCYCLIRDVPDALERVKFLKGINVDPFAQPYIDNIGTKATGIQRAFARWVNHKAEYNSRTWEDYYSNYNYNYKEISNILGKNNG